jgi:hypothetical protein
LRWFVAEIAKGALNGSSNYPHLKRFAVVKNEVEAQRSREFGLLPVVDRSSPLGLDVATAVLAELGQSAVAIDA